MPTQFKIKSIAKNEHQSTPALFNMSHRSYDILIGRDKELREVIEALCKRKKSNVILVGDPGVGKTAIVEGLVSLLNNENTSSILKGKTVFSLDVSQVVSHLEKIKPMLDAISKQGDILFIDEIHNIVGAGSNNSSLDIANIMKPYLASGELKCIGATTFDEFQKYFEKDAALVRRFSKITVNEPSTDDAIKIISGVKEKIESHHGVVIDDESITEAVTLSRRYLTDRNLPDSALDILDISCSRKSISRKGYQSTLDLVEKYKADGNYGEASRILYDVLPGLEKIYSNIVTSIDIQNVISDRTGVPVGDIASNEKDKLINLENRLKERIIGQDHAIKALSESARSSRVGLNDSITSFLFLGVTGIGKTETAKVLSEVLYNGNLIRLDMSEYKESHSIAKLIGAPAGYVGFEIGGLLTEAVRRKPFSVILLDEIEKANSSVWDLFLQVLDSGRLTDNKGRVVNFNNAIIIMTSNLKMDELKENFRPEFLGRISSTVEFNKLRKGDFRKIVLIELGKLSDKIKELYGVELGFKEDLILKIIELVYEVGHCRSIQQYINEFVKKRLVDLILSGKLSGKQGVILGLE